ncbi:MAG: hypothetical protein KBG48_07635 [Kofleriaceae bacterium]|nr:hypothetical protein [Kofleriaceae bacterium]MBP9167242.1 hypothetical protein [Kofleriaceae bacterium]MBP9863121.1 hypothetical protein [Kofleriaceae bacterium]
MLSLVEQLVTWLPQDRRAHVAVLDLEPLSGPATDLDRFLAEEITARLFATRRVEVVERVFLRRVMDELNLSKSITMDPDAAKRLGQLTGAEYVVVGRTSDLGDSVRVSIRALDTTTGSVVSTGVVTLLKEASLASLMGGRGVASARDASRDRKRPPNTLYYEDFESVNEGDAPPGWLGVDHFAVRVEPRGRVFSCFEKGPMKFTIPSIRLPESYQMEVVARQTHWTQSELTITVGVNRFGIKRGSFSNVAFLNKTDKELPAMLQDGASVRLTLERRGSNYRLSVDGTETLLGRYPDGGSSETWTIEFRNPGACFGEALQRLAVYAVE